VRARLLQQLGTMPPRRAPQSPRVTRVLHEDGLRFEHWCIAGPRDEIPAWFVCSETARTPAATLLALHPHGRQFEIAKSWVAGLAGDRSRAYGRAAAARGFAVLIPDLPGFEEHRPPLAERKSSYALQGETYERLLANSALVQGSTLQAWILADLRACVDVLEQEPRVDAQRIGVIGHSYGGQECIFAMLFDDRLRAGVASCGFSLVQLLVERRISHNMALYVPGLLPDLDFDVLVPALAPRPVCVIAGRDDPIYPVAGVERVAEAARAAWAAAGAAPAFQVRYFAGPHDLPVGELEFALGWLQAALRETG
jgi:dienelactone hydrolase